MKIYITSIIFALNLIFSTVLNAAPEMNKNMTPEARGAAKKVDKILVRCQKKLKLGKLQGYQQCALHDIQQLAEQGNFAAQYQLAEWADFEGKHVEALQWFQRGDDNPVTPPSVKVTYQERMQELKDFLDTEEE